jgi:hypothetical protein
MNGRTFAEDDLVPIERAVLNRMLERDGEAFAILRQQALVTRAASRQFTGVGFYTRLTVAQSAPRLSPGTRIDPIGGVGADIAGIRHGAGFVLFVADGAIETLEGFTYDEPWPDASDEFALFSTGSHFRTLSDHRVQCP